MAAAASSRAALLLYAQAPAGRARACSFMLGPAKVETPPGLDPYRCQAALERASAAEPSGFPQLVETQLATALRAGPCGCDRLEGTDCSSRRHDQTTDTPLICAIRAFEKLPRSKCCAAITMIRRKLRTRRKMMRKREFWHAFHTCRESSRKPYDHSTSTSAAHSQPQL